MANDGRDYWNWHARNYDRSMALLGSPLPRMLALVEEAVSRDGKSTRLNSSH